MLLLFFDLGGAVTEPLPEEQTTSYYGSGKAATEAALVAKVHEKYAAIDAARAQDEQHQRTQQAATRAVAKVKAKAIAGAAIELAALPPMDNPRTAQAQQTDDDQIMAIMALMLLED